MADSLPMIDPIPDIQPDGVVIDYRVFGNVPPGESGPFPSYNRGRTVSHEIGHYLGLIHIWGDGFSCSDNATDYCPDTPPQATYTSGCPTSPTLSCIPGTPAMKENYMDYTNDVCMNIFTLEQKARMRKVLRNVVRRKTLLQTQTTCGIADTQKPVVPEPDSTYKVGNNYQEGKVYLSAPDKITFLTVQAFSANGKEVQISAYPVENKIVLDLERFSQGVYFIRSKTSDGKEHMTKVVRPGGTR
jgi:hypothetical protein